MKKKYQVMLTEEQRQELLGLISSGQASARKLTHARILKPTKVPRVRVGVTRPSAKPWT